MKYIYCKTCEQICTFEEHTQDKMHDSSDHKLGTGGDHVVLGYNRKFKLPDDIEWFNEEVRAE